MLLLWPYWIRGAGRFSRVAGGAAHTRSFPHEVAMSIFCAGKGDTPIMTPWR